MREAPDAGTLPATKFAFPADQAAIIARPRLLRSLDDGVQRPLTLLAAPPGAGKTVLLTSWIASGAPPGPVAWLSLDAAEADRRRFWQAVIEALRRAGADEAVAGIGTHSQDGVNATVAALAGSLAELEEPIVLVLDDYQEAGDAAHGDLDRLLRHPAPALRVIIATRADPPLHLGRLRLQDQLAEIRAPDLAFTLDETAELLSEFQVVMDRGDLRRLWTHTEGWVGAVRLAALLLREHADPQRFVDDFAGNDRAVSEYLLSEVLSTLSADDRRFLLQTSILEVLSGDLANAVTERSDGRRRLADLARAGVLLAPLDRRGEWYRYHALFGELLRAELEIESPGELDGLHRRAAQGLAEHGDHTGALEHAVEGHAWHLAARLAGERWVDLLIRGEIATLRPLIERLPADSTVADPELALAVASALLDRGEDLEAARELERAAAAGERVPVERRRRFAASLGALQLLVSRLRGDLQVALETGRNLADSGGFEPGAADADLRALVLVNLGIAELWTGADEAALRLERARGAAVEAELEWIELVAVSHLALHAGILNDHGRAARLAHESIALAARRGWDGTWPAGGAYLVLATADFLADRIDDAARWLERATEALALSTERPLRAGLALLRSGMLAAHGQLETALAVLTAGAEELGDWPLLPAIRDQFPVREAVLRAQLGEREHATRLVAGDGGGPPSLPAAVVLAQLQLGQGDARAARATLAAWAPQLESERSPASVQGWLVDALALDAQGDHDGADAALERALDHAEPAGLRWSLAGFGRSLEPLLRRRLRRGTGHRPLVGDLIEALDDADANGAPRAKLVLEPLSPRERAVLRYLPTMMSNQEIASELFVSVNTVKTHLKAIYRKLDVADRREAVRRARMLELLAP